MTPKEKAIQLIENFKKNTRAFNETNGWEDSSYDAKQCALICVDELIKDNLHNENIVNGGLNAEYWQEVKKEIEQL